MAYFAVAVGGGSSIGRRMNSAAASNPTAIRPPRMLIISPSKNGNCNRGPSHGHANHVTTTPIAKPGPNGNSRGAGGPLTGVADGAGGVAGASSSGFRISSGTFRISAANDPTNSDITAICQPK